MNLRHASHELKPSLRVDWWHLSVGAAQTPQTLPFDGAVDSNVDWLILLLSLRFIENGPAADGVAAVAAVAADVVDGDCSPPIGSPAIVLMLDVPNVSIGLRRMSFDEASTDLPPKNEYVEPKSGPTDVAAVLPTVAEVLLANALNFAPKRENFCSGRSF